MKQLSLFREIIVDNFAGGGGASTGIEMATGMSVDIAINHDPAAIEMHKLNHPDTEHYCESVWDVDPKEACRGRKVGLAWFSPDCKHFSKAKGGKPLDQNIRGLAWVAVRWAKAVKPRVIMLENVEEFKTWGPLLENGYPDEQRKGETFQQFVLALEELGYDVEFRELRACDYGAPTIRKRFFMIARCDNKPIVWPDPTHGHPESLDVKRGMKKPWRTASEIIDWSIGTPSIFERKKPLAENTMKRIARGIKKFVIDAKEPFIIKNKALSASFLTQYYTETKEDEVRGQSLTHPIYTIPTANRFGLVTAHIMVNTTGHPGSSVEEPLKTITTGGHHALVAAFIAQHYKSSVGHEVVKPLNAITTVNKASLVQAFLTKYYGTGEGQEINEPLHTITTKDRFGLVTVHGTPYQIVDVGMRMLQPHELYAAQGFPTNYLIDRYADGRPIPKTEQVKRVGNSVPPDLPEALVRANLPELCAISSRYAVGI